MTLEHGSVVAVEEEPLGDELAKDYAAGASMIEVQDLSDFPEFGGSVALVGETVAYDRVDEDANTILLSAPTALDHSAEEPVLMDPPVKRYVAHVQIDDVPGEVVLADLSHSLKMYLPLGSRDAGTEESVVISNETGVWEVVDVLGSLPALVGMSLDIPDAGESGFHVDEKGNFASGGPNAMTGDFAVDDAGHLVAKTVEINARNLTAVALTINRLTVSHIGDLTQWFNDAGLVMASVNTNGRIVGVGIAAAIVGDTFDRVNLSTSSSVNFGDGSNAADVSLYRLYAGVLKTDQQFRADDGIATKIVAAAGKTTGSDADFAVAPPNGTIYVLQNTSNGDVRLAVKANGVWLTTAVLT